MSGNLTVEEGDLYSSHNNSAHVLSNLSPLLMLFAFMAFNHGDGKLDTTSMLHTEVQIV